MYFSAHMYTVSTVALATLVVAQQATISLYLPGTISPLAYDGVQGAIIGANDTVRTYDLSCVDGGDAECALPTPFTVVEGVNTVTYTATMSDATTTMKCFYESTDAFCMGTVTGGPSPGSIVYDAAGDMLAHVTITSGQEYLAKALATPVTTHMTSTDMSASTGMSMSTSTSTGTGTSTGTAMSMGSNATATTSTSISHQPSSAAGVQATGAASLGGAVVALAIAVAAL